jgi:hypothetical protein
MSHRPTHKPRHRPTDIRPRHIPIIRPRIRHWHSSFSHSFHRRLQYLKDIAQDDAQDLDPVQDIAQDPDAIDQDPVVDLHIDPDLDP